MKLQFAMIPCETVVLVAMVVDTFTLLHISERRCKNRLESKEFEILLIIKIILRRCPMMGFMVLMPCLHHQVHVGRRRCQGQHWRYAEILFEGDVLGVQKNVVMLIIFLAIMMVIMPLFAKTIFVESVKELHVDISMPQII